MASTVPLFPIHNIIVEITLRNKFPFYYIFSVPLTHLDIHVLDVRISLMLFTMKLNYDILMIKIVCRKLISASMMS